MRILFVCHRLPFPPDHGGKIRAWQMIRHLSQQHSVTVATLAQSQEELEQGSKLRECCEELLVDVVPKPVRWARAFMAVIARKSSSAHYFWSPRLNSRIAASAQAGRFDRIWVHCAFMASYVAGLPCDLSVLDYCDIDSAKWANYQRHKSFPLSLAYGLEANKLRRYEQQMGRRFSRCTVATSSELMEFEQLGVAKPCTVIPNGVDVEYFHPRRRAAAAKPVMVFVGRMDYFPNVDGVLHFVGQHWARIRAAVPQAELRIIGSNPAGSIVRLANLPGITVTGYVPDVRPYLADAVLGIAPLRIARGTQNKILEMMAMGIPVISSREAARGIRAVAGQHLAVADNDEFGTEVLQLLRSPAQRERLAAAGRAQVIKAHSWPASMEIVDEVLQLQEAPVLADAKPASRLTVTS